MFSENQKERGRDLPFVHSLVTCESSFVMKNKTAHKEFENFGSFGARMVASALEPNE